MRVLVLSTTTGYQLRSFGDAAERLGIELVLATDRCHQLDDPWRDGAIAVRFYDEEASLQAITAVARQRPFSGILAVGDRPTVLAARAAEALALPGNPVAAAEATRSKKTMRRLFAAAGMSTPWFFQLPADADPAVAAGHIAYPCVVKPLGLSGSRGVIKADTAAQFDYAVRRVRALLARPDLQAQRTGLTDELLVEGYIEGREYAVEGLMTHGELSALAVFDKPDPLDGPFFEETIYVTPSVLSPEVHRGVVAEVRRATAALGIVHGPIHAECRVGSGITMLEVAARPIGGLCSKVLRFTSEGEPTSLEEVLLRHATGEDVSRYTREPVAAGVMMIPIPRRGIYKGVLGELAARLVPGIDEVRITAKVDQLLEPLPEGDSYLGFIFARAPEPHDAVAALREAHRLLRFDVDPELRVLRGTS
ncbi:MAG TPA: ATP-grasp domain-containing protein [Vicinamibacterales bacterium]|nr:ATP-grasp domain-containing protein [Vicinamibacterales bacterium]